MPVFHFNVYDSVRNIDHEGKELADWPSARLEAIQLAGVILYDYAKRLAVGEDWRMEVTDHAGLILFRIDVIVAEAPVLSGRPMVSADKTG